MKRKMCIVKTSDAKLFLIKMQQDGKGSSTIKNLFQFANFQRMNKRFLMSSIIHLCKNAHLDLKVRMIKNRGGLPE